MVSQEDFTENPEPSKRKRGSIFGSRSIPFYRDVVILRILAQIAFATVFLGGLYLAFANLVNNLSVSNLSLDFNVFQRPFGVAISEGPSITTTWEWLSNLDFISFVYAVLLIFIGGTAAMMAFRQYRAGKLKLTPVVVTVVAFALLVANPPAQAAPSISDELNNYFYGGSMTRAFVTGIANTLSVVIISLIACTILGIFVGIGLLSSNFLVRVVAKTFVEIFRNTPLIVQLIFIYRTLTLLLPFPRESIFSPSQIGPITFDESFYIINARGFYFPAITPSDTGVILFVAILLSLVAMWFIRRQRLAYEERTGNSAYTYRIGIPVMLAIIAVGWLIAGQPFNVEYPALQGLNVRGGAQLTIGFTSLFLGLTFYTGAFIAEIVRAGIQAVPYGQIEAARSQGLTGFQVLSLVVLPQALRLIIPPLGNQYVNLGKNSSLGLAVNYADTYRIAQIANNESGQAVPFFVALMALYLTLSLTLSFLTNLVNRATQVRTR